MEWNSVTDKIVGRLRNRVPLTGERRGQEKGGQVLGVLVQQGMDQEPGWT